MPSRRLSTSQTGRQNQKKKSFLHSIIQKFFSVIQYYVFTKRSSFLGRSQWTAENAKKLRKDFLVASHRQVRGGGKGGSHIKRTGALVVPLRGKKKKRVWCLLEFSASKRSTVGAFAISFRALSLINMTEGIVLP